MNRIDILFPEKIGTILPALYGHFTEHIGGVFYDGLWVGEDSPVPNIRGFRKDLVEMLRKIKPPVIRWPGGCFAETYNWRDGIGPRDMRPKTVNWWYNQDGRLESNQVGTHEFVDFCRLVGAEPYFAANATSTTPLEIRNWLEYCNFPANSSSLAELRELNGSPEPFDIKYWGIGNENWGGGGNMTPEDYCSQFRRYAAIAGSAGTGQYFIACGPNGNDLQWSRRFFEKLQDTSIPGSLGINGYSAHYYCGTAGDALHFNRDQWYELLHKAGFMETLILQQRALMDTYDPERKIGLIIDEWGCWHPDGSGPSKGKNLFEQQSTMRDALVAALTLNIFNNHCDKVVMANIAQLANNLHCLFLASEEHLVATPTYHVFDLYKGHQGGQGLRTIPDTEKVTFKVGQAEKQLDRLSCSASLNGRTLTVTVLNLHDSESTETTLHLLGAGPFRLNRQVVLNAPDTHMVNTFDAPDAITPHMENMDLTGKEFSLILPPASVTLLVLEANA